MDKMQAEKFVARNVSPIRDWYQQKKKFPRRMYKVSLVVVVSSGVAIAGLSGVEGDWPNTLVALLGSITAVASALAAAFRWERRWDLYTKAQMDIEAAVRRFELAVEKSTGTLAQDPSDGGIEEAVEVLCSTVDSILSDETALFFKELSNSSAAK
jgi:hypothetical protein